MTVLDEVLARVAGETGVVGVVLLGSHARGTADGHSDYDVVVVTEAPAAVPWRHRVRSADLDEIVCTVDGLADTSVRWQRYAYRGARVLLDRLDGRIADLVARQATPMADEARTEARSSLDAYVNQLYRAVKSRRSGELDAARLDEIEAVAWLLEAVFALHGRLRPYNKYLRWELDTFPLPGDWNARLDPAGLPDRALALFPAVETLARQSGHGDVLDGWGDDIALIRAHATG